MVNSVNGTVQVMDAIFPLVAKYGGLCVALTLDEDGIPATARGRADIAKRIIARAAEYGIGKEDLIFDPLAMTISADTGAAKVTLEAVRLIHEELGALTTLGVSNVSFGLPERNLVTSTFFAMALDRGLDAAIMNPFTLSGETCSRTNGWNAAQMIRHLAGNCGVVQPRFPVLRQSSSCFSAWYIFTSSSKYGLAASGAPLHSARISPSIFARR